MCIQVLLPLRQVIRLLVYVCVAYDCLLLVEQLKALLDRLEALLVRVVPGAILEQMLGVLVSGLVRGRVQVYFLPSMLGSVVVDCLEDVPANLAHLFKRRQIVIRMITNFAILFHFV